MISLKSQKKLKFPLKFCAHRWIEDLPVAEWDISTEIYEPLQKFSKVEPTAVSYLIVKMAVGDPLFEAKLQFFIYMTRLLRSFLEGFQKDARMAFFCFFGKRT